MRRGGGASCRRCSGCRLRKTARKKGRKGTKRANDDAQRGGGTKEQTTNNRESNRKAYSVKGDMKKEIKEKAMIKDSGLSLGDTPSVAQAPSILS